MSDSPETPNTEATTTPPTEIGPLPPAQPRSKWPTIIGVIAIVYAAMSLLGNLWGVVSPIFIYAVDNAMPAANQAQIDVTKQWMPWTIISSLIGLALAAMLLIAGIGLTRRRQKAVKLGSTWAVTFIILVVVGLAIGYFVQQQTFDALKQAQPDNPMLQSDAAMLGMIAGGMCIGLVWGLALPVFWLIWFSRNNIKQEVATWQP